MLKTCKSAYSCKLHVDDHCQFEDSFCKREELVNLCYKNSRLTQKQLIPVKIETVKGEEHDREMYKILKDYESTIGLHVSRGDNVYIHSENCGNGKTAWAIRLLLSYLNIAWKLPTATTQCLGLFINVPKFINDLKNNISNPSEEFENLRKDILDANIVVWDEIATKALTDYEHEQLLGFINNRLDNGKANIYTSNMNEDELEVKLGSRLYSRIVNLSLNIHFTGVDKRSTVKGGDNK